MRSARIIRAPKGKQDPEEAEMAARARAAMRRLRGVKLNISDERITFDDVAGIGEAKVGSGFRTSAALAPGDSQSSLLTGQQRCIAQHEEHMVLAEALVRGSGFGV